MKTFFNKCKKISGTLISSLFFILAIGLTGISIIASIVFAALFVMVAVWDALRKELASEKFLRLLDEKQDAVKEVEKQEKKLAKTASKIVKKEHKIKETKKDIQDIL